MLVSVEVEGLAALNRGFKAVDKKLSRRLGQVNKKAGNLMATEARSRARALGGSAAKGADTIKATARAATVAVSLGGKAAPWMLGSEYGSHQYRQFPAWRGNQFQADTGNVGYFLHPAIRDLIDEFHALYGDLLEELLDSLPTR